MNYSFYQKENLIAVLLITYKGLQINHNVLYTINLCLRSVFKMMPYFISMLLKLFLKIYKKSSIKEDKSRSHSIDQMTPLSETKQHIINAWFLMDSNSGCWQW